MFIIVILEAVDLLSAHLQQYENKLTKYRTLESPIGLVSKDKTILKSD